MPTIRPRGGMAEWSKAPVLKTGVRCKAYREFESRSLRHYIAVGA